MQKQKSFEDTNISNFVFIITPTDAVFTRPIQHKRTLSLQKEQTIPIINKDRMSHKFDIQTSKITFRIINDKSLNYQWSVYKVFDGGELQEIQSMQFSILNFWKNFIAQYEKQTSSLNIRTKDDKEHKKVMQAWKQITESSQQKKAQLRVNSKKADFKLNFNIQAKSVLDQQLQEYQKQKLLRKQKQFERSQIRKSNLNATYAFMEDDKIDEVRFSEKFKKNKTEEQNTLIIPSSSTSRNFLSPIHQSKQSIKKTVSTKQTRTLSKKKSNDDIQQSLQISSQVKHSLKRINSFDKRETFYQREQLSLSSRIKNEKPKPIVVNQTNKTFQSVKMTVVYVILGFIMFWLLFDLMHHTSKVEYRNN